MHMHSRHKYSSLSVHRPIASLHVDEEAQAVNGTHMLNVLWLSSHTAYARGNGYTGGVKIGVTVIGIQVFNAVCPVHKVVCYISVFHVSVHSDTPEGCGNGPFSCLKFRLAQVRVLNSRKILTRDN